MLTSLVIKNFALIENQTIEFKKGFNVLVGETGAGKSLILDALNFVLGDKSSKLNLRYGTEKMFVQAVFDCVSIDVKKILLDYGIDTDEQLIITRVYNQDGRSESRIDGMIVPVSVVKSISSLLVDIYVQNENIELLKVKNHISVLDAYDESRIDILKTKINSILTTCNEIELEMSQIGGNKQNRERELELLEYQIKDIESAELKINEEDEIKEQINILSNHEKIFDALSSANNALINAVDSANNAELNLSNASKYNKDFEVFSQRVMSSKIELDDVNQTITNFLSSMEFDASLLEKLGARLDEINLLKRKYGNSIKEIFTYLEKIKTDYDNLLFGEEKLIKLESELKKHRIELYDLSLELSEIRKKTALVIEQNVCNELAYLGFKNAKFKIHFSNIPDIENAVFTKNGLDAVEFLLSANAGQELKNLSKTISGGEMSRFMLALKNVFAKCFNSSTLVFDEVDTGISGEIGQKVAERLAILSKSHQLICITHLCQVTAMADNYIYVSKSVNNNQTYTQISNLQGDEIIKYIALVSGAEPTDVAITFARELKQKADIFKQKI